MLEKLGHHPNIVGVKLTCGGIAKVARVRSRFSPETFCALAGQSDWLLPAISVGGIGTITGLANMYPKVSIWKQFALYMQALTPTITSRHASSYFPFPLAAKPKKPKLLKSNLRLLNGDLQRAVSMAPNGLLLSTWGIPRPVVTHGARIPSTPTPRSRHGLWISCNHWKPRRRVLQRAQSGDIVDNCEIKRIMVR